MCSQEHIKNMKKRNRDLCSQLYFFKKRHLLKLFFGLVLLSVACRPNNNETKTQDIIDGYTLPDPIDFDLAKIKERDTLIAIVDNSSTGYFLYKGQPMGYEYELLNLLAQELDVKLKLVVTKNIDEAFRKLNLGEGDIIAHNLTITKSRKEQVSFTTPHYQTRQVLVQRKPDNWRKMKLHEIEEMLIRNPIDLIGKEVYVRKGSSYFTRLKHLSEEVGGDILAVEGFADVETEALIKMVAEGVIDYTIADDDVAKVNKTYYPNIDIKTAISFPQRIAWAVRKNSPDLLEDVNHWISKMQKQTAYYVIYNKYFKNSRASYLRATSNYSSINGEHISPYDDLIKEGASQLNWDWRLLASLVFQESKFEPRAESWAGAKGLMQLLPETAAMYGANDVYNPAENVKAGVKYLIWLNKLWEDKVEDEQERLKFVLASYNVGQGHVLDARRLARKYGKDDQKWEGNVEYYMLQKSKPKYYSDPVVQSGYCRGEEPVNYVREIINRYNQYKQLIELEPISTELPT